jgi:hypothetical protein
MGIRVTELIWTLQPGAGYDIGVGDYSSSVWVIGTNPVPGGYGIYRWNGSNWDGIDGGAVRISVGPNNTPWVVTDVGNIFVLNGSDWQLLPGLATDIGVGADGSAWAIGIDPVPGGYGIYRWNGSDWDNMNGGAVRIAVSRDGTPWVVNDAGNIFVLNGGEWQLLPGLATDIATGIHTTWVTGINPVPGGYDIYYWKGDTEWAVVDGGAVNIAGDGAPWVITSEGKIFSSIVAAVNS